MSNNPEQNKSTEIRGAILDRLGAFEGSLAIIESICDQMEETPTLLTPETPKQPPKVASDKVIGDIQARLEDIYQSQEAA